MSNSELEKPFPDPSQLPTDLNINEEGIDRGTESCHEKSTNDSQYSREYPPPLALTLIVIGLSLSVLLVSL